MVCVLYIVFCSGVMDAKVKIVPLPPVGGGGGIFLSVVVVVTKVKTKRRFAEILIET